MQVQTHSVSTHAQPFPFPVEETGRPMRSVSEGLRSGETLPDEEAAFSSLFFRHRDDLQRYLYRKLGSLEEAEDAVSLTFCNAWRARASFRGQASCKTWLYQIATRVALDTMRRRRRRPVEQDLEDPEADLAQVPDDETYEPERVLLDAEHAELTREAVNAAIDRLSPEARRLVRLYYFDGYNYDQISSELGISYGKIRGRLHLIRERLRRDMQQRQCWGQIEA